MSKLSREWRLFQAFGIPVFAHWSLLLVLPVAWAISGRLVLAVVAFTGFVILMLVHEYGHAIVARRLGIHVFSVRLRFMHGVCEFEEPETLRSDVAVAWGGVLAQGALLLAAIPASVVLTSLSGGFPRILEPAFFVWIPINVLVIVLNLLPLRPLDGHMAWQVIFFVFQRRRAASINSPRSPRRAAGSEVVSIELHRLGRKNRGE